MDAVYEILMRSFLVFAWMGSMIGMAVGAGLLLVPEKTIWLNQYFGTWVDTAAVGAELDRPRSLERHFYRHHKWTGAALTLGAVFVLYMFLIAHVMQKVARFIGNDTYGLLDAFSAVIVIGSSLAFFLGLVLFGRPSLLRELEDAANRWISTDKLLQAFNSMHLSFDSFIVRHRKPAGVFFLLGGLFATFRLSEMLLSGDWKLLLGN